MRFRGGAIFVTAALTAAIIGGACFTSARGQAPGDTVYVPDSSIERPGDAGRRAHTNHILMLHNHGPLPGPKAHGSGGTVYITPQLARAAYGLPSTGGSGIIAIVDAYDYPTAQQDFDAFSAQYGLPTTSTGAVLQIHKMGSPAYDQGWSQEEALDIQWAHAMAPGAQILLVEAASNSFSDLLAAVDYANSVPGVTEVSMSWGSSEFSSETGYDSHFKTNAGIVYFAASGDTGGVTNWPGVSQNVVCAGGTTLKMDSSGTFLGETGWSGSGGGASAYVPIPPYQSNIMGIVGSQRGTPDLSFDADPNTGVIVRWQGAWYAIGGTSVSTPSLAGIVNLASSQTGHAFASDSAAELTGIYQNGSNGADFRDITSGRAGRNRCATGWDFVTGWGSNLGLNGK